jgi:hypothetical protein
MKKIQYLRTVGIEFINPVPYPFSAVDYKYRTLGGRDYFQYLVKEFIMPAQMSRITGTQQMITLFCRY